MRWKATVAIVCVFAVLAPAGPVAHAGDQDDAELKRIRARLERTRDALAETNRERDGVLAELASSDARRNQLTARIGDLTVELAGARRRLAGLRRRLDRTRFELFRWTRRVQDVRHDLRVQEATLDNRAATAYRLGPAGYLAMILGAEDLRSLVDRAEFLESVLESNTELVVGIRATEGTLAQHEVRVREYERRVNGQWNKVKAEADRIARLRREQLALRAQVDEEIALRQGLLGDIEAQRRKYIAAVRELEAQSAAIGGALDSGGSHGDGRGHGQLYWPADGPITSGFGWRVHPIFGTRRFHSGVDIDAGCGAPNPGGRVRMGHLRGVDGRIWPDHRDRSRQRTGHAVRAPVIDRGVGRPVGAARPAHRERRDYRMVNGVPSSLRGPASTGSRWIPFPT
jgi:murein DD-endopeptidase MepM/ murein hydrolase activator NlpD